MSPLLFLFFFLYANEAALLKFNFVASRMFAAHDCFSRSVIAINNQVPGPTIRAKTGDVIEVTVVNRLEYESLAIHWHGIYQVLTPWMDGAAQITQCTISPGDTFVYRFTVKAQAGTYWWHAHNSILRSEGVYGALIIDAVAPSIEPFVASYTDERLIMLTDWYHQPASTIATGLNQKGQFTFPGNGDAVLVNQKGQSYNYLNSSTGFDCRTTPSACANCPREVISVLPNTTYRFRIINAAALGFFNFAIEGHTMKVVEADGTPTVPFVTETLDIASGQRYSVLVKTDQASDNYWMTVQTRFRGDPFTANPSGAAVLQYLTNGNNSSSNATVSRPIPDSAQRPAFNATKLQTYPSCGIRSMPKSSNRTFIFKVTQANYPVPLAQGGQMRWPLNGIPLELPATPILWSTFLRLNISNERSRPINLKFNEVVDIVVQNGVALNGVCESHPWHLHGHGFWVVSVGNGTYPNDLLWNGGSSPIYRDTEALNPTVFAKGASLGAPAQDCGWVKLRFVANNPGSWLFHCHVEWHIEMGMGIVFNAAAERIPRPPVNSPICGGISWRMLAPYAN